MSYLEKIGSRIAECAESYRVKGEETLGTLIRSSYNTETSSMDGALIHHLEKCILQILAETTSEEKILACNELAFAERLDTMDESFIDLDYSIGEAFIEPSLDIILKGEA